MDLYRDFAYCTVTGAVDATTTTVPVDELGRLPSNADLAAGEFWMTFESTYALNQFEIVRLVSKSAETGAGTLVVERARHGSTGYARSPGVILKHAVTAETLRHLVALASYKRYVDLGNVALTGVAQCFSDPTVLRGVSAGQAGGSTVVAGAIVVRGMEASVNGRAVVTGAVEGSVAMEANTNGQASVTGDLSRQSSTFSDDFNRADGSLAMPPYAPGTTAEVIGNKCGASSGTKYLRLGYTDGDLDFTYEGASSSSGMYLVPGVIGTEALAMVFSPTGFVELRSRVDNSLVASASVGGTGVTSGTVRCTIVGNVYKIYFNGVLKLERDHGAHTRSGYLEMNVDTTITYDNINFTVGYIRMISDDFNRADGAVANGWSATGVALVWEVISNTLRVTSGSGDGQLIRPGRNDGVVRAKAVDSTMVSCGLVFRHKDANNYLMVDLNGTNGNATLYKRVGGTYTAIVSNFTTFTINDIFEAQFFGTTVRVLKNQTQVWTGTVTDFVGDTAAINVGFRKDTAGGTGGQWDDFIATEPL